ncbi:Uncharacterised protein [Neisseria meningitidis]|nr:Uncharacterised protein [Neisseria meningitidis]CWO30427.1 Uncharacterised protein [Neisseria meningitidis]CWQ37490.1 Uncharacterised protein [Neisseria meningitidis]CWR15977.1 Uncharacterised protein [Neisseria meningitidis]CWR29566.1 Uncharacterised protein [Neisseria meningitidis]
MRQQKELVRDFAIRIAVILRKCLSSIKEMKMGILKWKMGNLLKQKTGKITQKNGESLKQVLMVNI